MGKKEGKKREREIEEEEEEEMDPELQAELNAVMAIRAEKQQKTLDLEESAEGSSGAYNQEALLQYCESIGTENLPFIESLQVAEYDLSVQDVNDDLEREMTFYNHALAAVNVGRAKLTELGVKFRRPDDFFCESVKSDAHMARIKDKLILEEKKIQAFEQRKNRDVNKKFNKQVAALRKEQKLKSTKDEIKDVKRLRSGDSSGDAVDKELEKVLERNKKYGRGEGDRNRSQKSAKRLAYDRKYGFGGKNSKKSKLNDAKSLNDMSDFNPRGGALNRRDKGGKHSATQSFPRGRGGKKNKSANRPGKASRAAARKARSS